MKKKILIMVGTVIVFIGLVIGGVGLKDYLAEKNAGRIYDELKIQVAVDPLISVPTVDEKPLEIPIDFETLTAKYPDVYAWIVIPGTNVDYPILRKEGDNSYYLTHTIDGKKKKEGSIYTEDYNSKDFSDPNTLIYGHNMKNGTMFRSLHKFEDKQFFDENSEIIIYQKDRILRYKIFAAYVYDDRHIMLSFDFNDENIFRSYLNSIFTKKEMSANINETVSVTTKDKIITLSTCDSKDDQRYLVQAVLLSIQE